MGRHVEMRVPQKQALFWAGCSGRHEGRCTPLSPRRGGAPPRALGCQRGARGGRSPGLTLPGSGASGPSVSSTAPASPAHASCLQSVTFPPGGAPTAWTAVGIPLSPPGLAGSWRPAAGGGWLAALRSSRSGGEEQEARPLAAAISCPHTKISKYTDSIDFKSPRVISTGV